MSQTVETDESDWRIVSVQNWNWPLVCEHWLEFYSLAELLYPGIKHNDWLKLVMWLATSLDNSLFQSCVPIQTMLKFVYNIGPASSFHKTRKLAKNEMRERKGRLSTLAHWNFNCLLLSKALLETKHCEKLSTKTSINGDHHSSVVSSAPTILRLQVQIPSTPCMLFSICIIEIVMRKGRK